MPKFIVSVLAAILILLLTAFFALGPQLLNQGKGDNSALVKDLMVQRFSSVGNLIAHSPFVEDAVIMSENAQLAEVITTMQRDEPEIALVNFVDNANKIIASSSSDLVGQAFQSNIIASSEPSAVREKAGVYEAGFSINIGTKRVGVLYFEAKPKMPGAQTALAPNPIFLAVGIGVALVVFLITFSAAPGVGTRPAAAMNRQEEKAFSPKVEALKKQETELQQQLEATTKKLSELNNEYEAKRKLVETSPVFQSVEKLKTTEAKLLKDIEVLKEQEAKFTKEMELLNQKRDEIVSTLEAEKKEESILHEKLSLIKKKILRLETPEK